MAAAAAGADAIGLIFYPPSPRNVSITTAREIAQALPPFVTVVGVVVDPDPAFLADLIHAVAVDVLQFHGSEPATFCRSAGRPYLKALRAGPDADLGAQAAEYPDARGILVDAYDEELVGGIGRVFPWAMAREIRNRPVILAGGLDRHNVAAAIARVRPDGVDVSSGVESAQGIKDAEAIGAFVRAVREADARLPPRSGRSAAA